MARQLRPLAGYAVYIQTRFNDSPAGSNLEKAKRMARKPAAQQGDTHQEIAQAAFRLFGKYGYDGVSMATVAEAAAITKASLYWHFASKDELYIACLKDLHLLFREYVFTPLASQAPALERFQRMFQGVADLVIDRRIRDGIAGYWLEPSTSELGEAKDVRQVFRRETTDLVATAIEAGIAEGTFTPDVDIHVQEMAHAVIAITEAIVLPLREKGPEASRHLIATLARTFYRAYSLPRGTQPLS